MGYFELAGLGILSIFAGIGLAQTFDLYQNRLGFIMAPIEKELKKRDREKYLFELQNREENKYSGFRQLFAYEG